MHLAIVYKDDRINSKNLKWKITNEIRFGNFIGRMWNEKFFELSSVDGLDDDNFKTINSSQDGIFFVK